MNRSNVRDVLDRIEKLSEADRVLLDEQLEARAEAEWQREAAAAEDVARERGIDQAAIDRAVEEVRYPRANGDAR